MCLLRLYQELATTFPASHKGVSALEKTMSRIWCQWPVEQPRGLIPCSATLPASHEDVSAQGMVRHLIILQA